METFEQWIERTGRDTKNVGALVLGKDAWEAAKAQSCNYVADEEIMPSKVTFANGRIVYIASNPNQNVQIGVYLEVEQEVA